MEIEINKALRQVLKTRELKRPIRYKLANLHKVKDWVWSISVMMELANGGLMEYHLTYLSLHSLVFGTDMIERVIGKKYDCHDCRRAVDKRQQCFGKDGCTKKEMRKNPKQVRHAISEANVATNDEVFIECAKGLVDMCGWTVIETTAPSAANHTSTQGENDAL